MKNNFKKVLKAFFLLSMVSAFIGCDLNPQDSYGPFNKCTFENVDGDSKSRFSFDNGKVTYTDETNSDSEKTVITYYGTYSVDGDKLTMNFTDFKEVRNGVEIPADESFIGPLSIGFMNAMSPYTFTYTGDTFIFKSLGLEQVFKKI